MASNPLPPRAPKPEFVAPRDAIEALLADVWLEILQLDQVGVHDDFFAQGGDSLRATRVVARLNELFELNQPATALFTYPTIALLAEALRLSARPERLALIAETMRELESLSDRELATRAEVERTSPSGKSTDEARKPTL